MDTKKITRLCVGNLIYEYEAIILLNRANEKTEQSAASRPEQREEIFLFQLRLES